MRACVCVLGLLGPLGGCFVDPGNATVGGPGGGSTTGSTGGVEVTGAASTGGAGSGPEPTGSGTSTGADGSTTTGGVLPETGTGATDGTTGTTGMATTLDTSTGGSSTGGVELPVPGCVPLFFTDFSQDPKDVLEMKGQWIWNSQLGTVTLQAKDGESSQALTKEGWGDAVVHARVRVSSGYAVVRVRHIDGLLGGMTYFGSMQPSADKLQLGRRVNGQSTVFKSPTFPTEFGLWYTMTIAAQGNDLSFGLDDQVLTAASDGELNKGGASIGGYGPGVAEFDWLLVCAAD